MSRPSGFAPSKPWSLPVRVLAIEAGRTILLDHSELIDFANKHRLVVLALSDPTALCRAA